MEEVIEKIEKIDLRKFNGGKRAGAGMPKGKKTKKTLVREAATMYLIRRIEENIKPLTDALIEKALEKDMQALKEAFERGLGKVKETHKLEGELNIKGVNISIRE
jgi:hypothetical protein